MRLSPPASAGACLVPALLAACAGRSGEPLSPTRLDVGAPPPGLCSIVTGTGGRAEGTTRSCDEIEYAAPEGSRIIFRPDDSSRRVVVCYMDIGRRNWIDGVEVFDLDTGDLIEIIQHHGDPPPSGGCANALAFSRRGRT
jgi:hypothetical protein